MPDFKANLEFLISSMVVNVSRLLLVPLMLGSLAGSVDAGALRARSALIPDAAQTRALPSLARLGTAARRPIRLHLRG